MMSRASISLGRCLAVWAGATLVAALLLTWVLPHLVRQAHVASFPPPVARFEDWLVLGCDAAAVVGLGWLWLLVSLISLEAAGSRPRRHRGVPAGVRRLVLAACGAGLVGGLVAPAYASASPSPLDGLPMPDRPATVAPAGSSGHDARPAPTADARPDAVPPAQTVRVAPGDTLWDIAAAALPGGASAAVVDAHWRAIHAANRGVIGEDPDLLRPGQRLRLPPPDQSPPAT